MLIGHIASFCTATTSSIPSTLFNFIGTYHSLPSSGKTPGFIRLYNVGALEAHQITFSNGFNPNLPSGAGKHTYAKTRDAYRSKGFCQLVGCGAPTGITDSDTCTGSGNVGAAFVSAGYGPIACSSVTVDWDFNCWQGKAGDTGTFGLFPALKQMTGLTASSGTFFKMYKKPVDGGADILGQVNNMRCNGFPFQTITAVSEQDMPCVSRPG